MQGKIKYLFVLVSLCIMCFVNKSDVQGYTGKGTKDNPYVITKETELREILTTKISSKWKYIEVNSKIFIRKTITINSGKFRLYAKGTGRTLMRSGDISDPVNSQAAPKYCIIVNGNANVVFGYEGSKNQLILNGNKASFSGNKKSSGFVYVGENANVTIDKRAVLTNVKNNKSEKGGTAVFSVGSLTVHGEISNCEGTDGGAIGIKKGKLYIQKSANIHNCISATEGGGIFGIEGCDIEMNGGTIQNCVSKEEGGGIFVSGKSKCRIVSGNIIDNKAGLTGGGVFSGGGAAIAIGKEDGTGPQIIKNYAETIGGGIRCNGGSGSNSGGTSYFYGGYISNNIAGKNTGGLSCGPASSGSASKIYVRNMHIENNSGKEGIGGIRIPASAVGVSTNEVYITDCEIQGNKTDKNSGGLQVDGSVIVINSSIRENYSKKNGGGIYINNGTLQMNSGMVTGNQSGQNGHGVYVAGSFKLKEKAYVETNNEVYLTKGTYIDVIGKLYRAAGLIAKINSQIKENGTRLVRANYSGGNGHGELYYADGKNSERYQCTSIAEPQLLRPSNDVNGFEKNWIIISERYKIHYDKNTGDIVKNVPKDQEKYWNENINLSQNSVTREGYILENEKHWNTKSQGDGTVYSSGEIYRVNRNITLYAIWKRIAIKEIYINTVSRYYAINQRIVLNSEELLKKVTTDDDLHTGKTYKLQITRIDRIDNVNIAKGNDITTEDYMSTDMVNEYILTVEAKDDVSGVKASARMYVYILNRDLSNGQIRFISYNFFRTLDISSKWNKRLKNKLLTSLRKKNNSIYNVYISRENILDIKNNIKDNNYNISHEMNKSVVGKLGL